ncbi:MAG TPA: UbiX family flavin prenyltransferase [Acidimicrobiia bacterium]|nr:UbiX family flavin prenyltransferase [Acidimicrobiia bacterium]
MSIRLPDAQEEITTKRIIVGISGSSGAVYGARLLEVLASMDGIETHLVISKGAVATLEYETDYLPDALAAMADVVHDERSLGATIASGTFRTDGMVVAPCSMKTVSAIANSYNDNLIVRAADVCLKERRRLVLVVRETPLHLGHLRLLTAVTEAGAVVLPPVPGFYTLPKTIGHIVDHTVTKVLDQFDIDAGLITRWAGSR